MKKGLVHIYTGEGKGKTTAAFGLAIRAVGNGLKVCIFQFLKGEGSASGEVKMAKRLGETLQVVRFKQIHPIFWPEKKKTRDALAELKKSIRQGLGEVKEAVLIGNYDMIILDEILVAISHKLVDASLLLDIIESKPAGVELVLTGRGAPDKLIKKADYVTDMREVKHPYKKGITARRGIEA